MVGNLILSTLMLMLNLSLCFVIDFLGYVILIYCPVDFLF